jgi:hypothetical protein
MALHSGIIAITCLIRFILREHLFFTLTIIKVVQGAFFLELCLISGLSTVKTDNFDKDYSMSDYWFDLAIGLGAGVLLGLVSKITSALCGGGMLIHESYMTFWSSLTTLILSPVFIGFFLITKETEIKTELSID